MREDSRHLLGEESWRPAQQKGWLRIRLCSAIRIQDSVAISIYRRTCAFIGQRRVLIVGPVQERTALRTDPVEKGFAGTLVTSQEPSRKLKTFSGLEIRDTIRGPPRTLVQEERVE